MTRITTFFEMLGSWSFGDYFKRTPIKWAWSSSRSHRLPRTSLRDVFGQPDAASCDDETRDMWRELIPEDILKRAT